jgi:chromosome segregation ATPase
VPQKKGPSAKVAAAVAKELSQLRKKADELRARLDAEIQRREVESKVLREAKKARDQVAAELKLLRQQAAKGATELKKALTDATRREQARMAAAAKVEELKADLRSKTAELKRKSNELARLAMETATKAKDILVEGPPGAQSGTEPPPAPEPAPVANSSSQHND